MSELPVKITLVGQGATNPALPSRNIEGTLTVEYCNLTFTSNKFVHKIPLEHIDRMYPLQESESWGDEWRILLCLLLSGVIFLSTLGLAFIPLIWLFWWEYSPIEVQLVVTAWDEQYGLRASTVFSLGNKRRYREDVQAIIQQIWGIRGDCRQFENSKTAIIFREN